MGPPIHVEGVRGKYFTIDRDAFGIQYEIEMFEALLNNPNVTELARSSPKKYQMESWAARLFARIEPKSKGVTLAPFASHTRDQRLRPRRRPGQRPRRRQGIELSCLNLRSRKLISAPWLSANSMFPSFPSANTPRSSRKATNRSPRFRCFRLRMARHSSIYIRRDGPVQKTG